ncbi:MFS transporter [Algisphaera agarilytica]|uniref:PPP family 3-phenylpropionic acid transporter n=1 Tax=Algisphaera agarilytica TaxID=1385975 RepID=A0A7X0H780_9BACT|nr:MFS transporter [Algisphaera agarilytica]MBB6429396.1 PPP family 3-phenylpropionic acid transporter [Algisphaera agarilytica]
MRAIKSQFFLSFTVMGSVLPYLSVFLEQRGLTMSQIGWVLSLTGVAVVVTPVITAALADTRMQGRTLLGLMFAGSGLTLAWLTQVDGYWTILIVHGLFALAFAPVTSLQDGLYFQRGAELEARGQPVQDYHIVRVFGTFGFIVPSLLLYFILRHESVDTTASVWCGAVCCGVGVLNAVLLPKIERAESEDQDTPSRKRQGLPTAAALRALCEPHVLVFCVAMFLIHLAITAYYGFYPVYLTQTVGIEAQWVGLIANLGVVIEIGFMLGFGWFMRHWGIRKLMVVGGLCMIVRYLLLGFFPNVGVAVGTQVFHGIMVLVVHVAPPIYLNRRADKAFRNSIQGLYAMVVFGTGRIAGNLIAGWIADVSLTAVFLYAMVLTLIATALFAFAFADGATHAKHGGGDGGGSAKPQAA